MTFGFSPPPIVVDASAAVELLSGDPTWTDNFEAWVADDRMLLAPVHFLAEVANGMLIGQRLALAEAESRLDRVAGVGIEVADGGFLGLHHAMALADRHRLTVYDALYLQLAVDVGGELATLDRDLRKAARAEAVPLA